MRAAGSPAAALAATTAVLALLLALPLAAAPGSRLPAGGDDLYLAWLLDWIARALATGPAGVFDAPIFYPVESALAFSTPMLAPGALVAPAAWLGAGPALLLNLVFFASFVLCALAARALVLEWTGSEAAGAAAGILFAFSPLRFTHLDHVQLLPFWWTPLALLHADRFLRRGRARDAALAAVHAAAQAWSSIYLGAFCAVALALAGGLALATGRARLSGRRLLGGAVGSLFLSGLLCLPLALAYAEVRLTWAAARTLEQAARYSASPLAFVSAHPDGLVWGRALAAAVDPVAPWEKLLFPGLVPLGLAALALRRAAGAWAVRYGLALAAAGAVLALGPVLLWQGESTGVALPYRAAFELLPPLRALRAPARFALLASLGLAVAAGVGAARLRPAVRAAALAAAVLEALVHPFPAGELPPLARPGLDAFLAAGGGPLVELPLAADEDARRLVETHRMLHQAVHRRPLVNGYSGYTPPPHRALVALEQRGDLATLLEALTAWEVRTLVLHLDALPERAHLGWARLEREGAVRAVHATATVRVLEATREPPPFAPFAGRLGRAAPLRPGERVRLEPALEVAAGAGRAAPPGLHGWRRERARWASARGGATRPAKVFCPPLVAPVGPGGGAAPDLPAALVFLDAPEQPGAYEVSLSSACVRLRGRLEVAAPQ